MKKIVSLLLAGALTLSLAACEDSGTSQGNVESNQQDTLTSTKWVSLYTGITLVLNTDQTMSLGDSDGTWSQDDNSLTLSYTNTSGETTEQSMTITGENEITVLQADNGMKYYSEDTVDDVRESVSYQVGDTVSTDIIELTVENADLSYYADETCEPVENEGFFTSNTGNTLVCLDFTITNTDRADLDTNFLSLYFTALQNGNYSTVKGYDFNNPDGQFGLNFAHALIAAAPEGGFVENGTSNLLLYPGSSYQIRVVGVANFEADDLSAPFYLMANIPDSDGNINRFIYAIK